MRAGIAETFRRLVFERSLVHRSCLHFIASIYTIDDFASTADACPTCQESGTRWAQLRRCLTCGSVGCCDSSEQPHARAHFEATGHPTMRSIEPGDSWAWCYVDRVYMTWVTKPEARRMATPE